jgi:hypothetical protein
MHISFNRQASPLPLLNLIHESFDDPELVSLNAQADVEYKKGNGCSS